MSHFCYDGPSPVAPEFHRGDRSLPLVRSHYASGLGTAYRAPGKYYKENARGRDSRPPRGSTFGMEPVSVNDTRPLLIYDGDCGFCKYWVHYWQKLTGDRVVYAPYQEAAAQHPEVPVTAFQNAIQYISSDGKIATAAEASFLTLSHARGKGIWLAIYRNIPGFAVISELAYAFIAAHRPAFHRL